MFFNIFHFTAHWTLKLKAAHLELYYNLHGTILQFTWHYNLHGTRVKYIYYDLLISIGRVYITYRNIF